MSFLAVLFLVGVGFAPALYGISSPNPFTFMWSMLGWLAASPIVAIILSETFAPSGSVIAVSAYAAWVLPSWIVLFNEATK